MPVIAANSFTVAAAITRAKEDTAVNSTSNTVGKSGIVSSNSPIADSSLKTNVKEGLATSLVDDVVRGELLVNFERHRTAAAIVKSLLRLLHASSKYNFKPVPELISRCLWMAALPDDEITIRSRDLI